MESEIKKKAETIITGTMLTALKEGEKKMSVSLCLLGAHHHIFRGSCIKYVAKQTQAN